VPANTDRLVCISWQTSTFEPYLIYMTPPKQRILVTAARLFHQQGYKSTGINQLIAESGVAKASFYYYFKSKEDLCVDFLNQRHEFWFKRLNDFTEKQTTSKEKILACFDFLLSMNESEQFRGCSFLNILSEISAGNQKILEVIQQHKKELINYFETILADSQLSNHVYLLFESAIIESQLFRDQWPVNKSKSIINSILS
jgi:AcrR family transcriptional regulator